MSKNNGFWAQVDHEGRLVIPSEAAIHYGLKAGTMVRFEEEMNGFHLHRPVTHLQKVYIEPTSRCNLTCRTCIRNTWNENLGFMTRTTYSRIVEGLQSLPTPVTVFFGGFGEPLAHPDIIEMVAEAKSTGARVELITNGTLLNKKRSTGLIDSGLDMLWVSIDGASPESYADVRLGASLPKVIENVSWLRAARGGGHFPKPEIGVVFVAMKRNIADLPSVLRLSKRLGATQHLVTNVLPYTVELCDEVLYRRVLNDILYLQSPWVPQLDIPRIEINEHTRLPLDQVKRGLHNISLNGDNMSRASDRCPFIERGATVITWDGNLSPCLPLAHNHVSFPNRRMRTSRCYTVGNIKTNSLGELWSEPQYTHFRERVQRFEFSPCTFCGGCELSEANEEDCYGNTFPVCGGCLWAQGVIQCP